MRVSLNKEMECVFSTEKTKCRQCGNPKAVNERCLCVNCQLRCCATSDEFDPDDIIYNRNSISYAQLVFRFNSCRRHEFSGIYYKKYLPHELNMGCYGIIVMVGIGIDYVTIRFYVRDIDSNGMITHIIPTIGKKMRRYFLVE
jgi:hypothetical protein